MVPNQQNNHLYGLIAQTREKALAVGSTTDNVPEGSTHLYFTSARGRGVISASTPLAYSISTGIMSIPVATGSVSGYLSSTDWTTFNGKANAFTGYTGTVTVRNSDNTGTVAMTFSNGVLTGVA